MCSDFVQLILEVDDFLLFMINSKYNLCILQIDLQIYSLSNGFKFSNLFFKYFILFNFMKVFHDRAMDDLVFQRFKIYYFIAIVKALASVHYNWTKLV